MIDFKIEVDDKEAKELFAELSATMGPRLGKRMMGKVLTEVRKSVKKDYLKGQVLRKHTGILANSYKYKVFPDFTAYIENIAFYAPLQELGGQILPKNGEYLTFKINDTEYRKSKGVTLPARPTLKPAVEDMFSSGKAQVFMEGIMQIALKELEDKK